MPPIEDEIGELADATKPDTVGRWHDDTRVTFTHPMNDAVAAFGVLSSSSNVPTPGSSGPARTASRSPHSSN